MSEPVTMRAILQGKLKELDAKLDKLEPATRAAEAAFNHEKEAAQTRLQELGAKWQAVNKVYSRTRAERETVWKALEEA
jgi:Skp family chaperone for outer membrane proteins